MYRVEVDGHTIHDPRDEHFILPYAKLDLELNKTGSQPRIRDMSMSVQ